MAARVKVIGGTVIGMGIIVSSTFAKGVAEDILPDTQTTVFGAVVFILGGFAMFGLREAVSTRTSSSAAYIEAREAARTEREVAISALRAEFEERFRQQAREHAEEIAEIQESIERFHTAVSKLVEMVPAERMGDAIRVLSELNAPTSRQRRRYAEVD